MPYRVSWWSRDRKKAPARNSISKYRLRNSGLSKRVKIKKEKPLPEITEDEVPFDIPESWAMVRFGSVVSLLSGTDFKPEDYNNQGEGTVYITGASNLSEEGVIVSRWTETPRNIANRGDVL